MKYYILVLTILISGLSVSQNHYLNIQKKHIVEGYDVVAYFENKAIKGSKDFEVVHNDASFLFSSKANAEKFKSNPEAYIPQYGGYCAYAIAKKGKKVKVNPETFEIRNNELYLFYNKGKTNTLKFWLNENTLDLIKKANTNWLKII